MIDGVWLGWLLDVDVMLMVVIVVDVCVELLFCMWVWYYCSVLMFDLVMLLLVVLC